MAMQPIDYKKAKERQRTSPGKLPAMVRRSNKRILIEIAPMHVATKISAISYYWQGDSWWRSGRDW